MDNTFTESVVEQATLDWFDSLDYDHAFGPDLAFVGLNPERENYHNVILTNRLQQSLHQLNLNLPDSTLQEAFQHLTHSSHPSLLRNNHAFHRILVEGIPVDYHTRGGRLVSGCVRVIDFDDIDNNDWLVVNQYTVEASYHNNLVNRRPDIVIFINGLPLGVIELKNAADPKATIWSAFNQLQTYKEQIPSLFVYNELLIISDGLNARIGSLTAGKEWFLPWKTISGETVAPSSVTQLEVLIRGRIREKTLSRSVALFHRLRDRSWCSVSQENRWLSSVPRGQCRR